jgi:hypothetical protein
VPARVPGKPARARSRLIADWKYILTHFLGVMAQMPLAHILRGLPPRQSEILAGMNQIDQFQEVAVDKS